MVGVAGSEVDDAPVAVESLDLLDFLRGQGETEQVGILLDPLLVSRLRDDHDVILDGPPQGDLSRSLEKLPLGGMW